MARTYTGSEIVAKVLQATKLIEEGALPSKVWNEVHITRQTYHRWKEICDSIYSDFKAQADSASRKLASTKRKMQKLEEQLKIANVKLKDTGNEVRNLKSQPSKTIKETATTDKNLEHGTLLKEELKQLKDELKMPSIHATALNCLQIVNQKLAKANSDKTQLKTQIEDLKAQLLTSTNNKGTKRISTVSQNIVKALKNTFQAECKRHHQLQSKADSHMASSRRNPA